MRLGSAALDRFRKTREKAMAYDTTGEPAAPLGKYVLIFTGYVLLCALIIMALPHLFAIELPSSMGIATTIAATGATVQHFVAKERRAITKAERRKLALHATLASFALSAVFIGIAAAMAGFSVALPELAAIPAWLWVVLLAIGVALSWVLIYFLSDFLTRAAVKRLAKG
jgi:MFS family permease